MRLGKGEFYNPQNLNNRVDEDALEMFWYKLQEIVPEILDDILQNLFPVYKSIHDNINLQIDNLAITPLNWNYIQENINESLQQLIIDFTRRWNLQTLPRVYDTILSILYQWAITPYLIGILPSVSYVTKVSRNKLTTEEQQFQYLHLGWDTTYISESKFRALVLSDFEKELSKYIENIKAISLERGLKQTPEKRNIEHFEWLVRYQVQEWSHMRIADYYYKGDDDGSLGTDTVSRAIKKTSKLIGLKLRPPHKGGRPKNINNPRK